MNEEFSTPEKWGLLIEAALQNGWQVSGVKNEDGTLLATQKLPKDFNSLAFYEEEQVLLGAFARLLLDEGFLRALLGANWDEVLDFIYLVKLETSAAKIAYLYKEFLLTQPPDDTLE